MSTTMQERPRLVQPPAGFAALPLAGMRWVEGAGATLFAPDPSAARPSVLCSRTVELSQDRLAELLKDGVMHAYVRSNEVDRVARHVRSDLDAALGDGEVAPEARMALLQLAAATEIDGSFRLVKCERYVSVAQRFGKLIAQLACENNLDAGKLFALLRHDERKCSRVVNVAAYCAILARQLGTSDPAEVEEITIGAMLYDIGERFIPKEILNKNGPLSGYDRGIIEQHPRTALLNLMHFGDVTDNQRLMAYQHHERVNGKGYPVRLTGEEIHDWSRMVAVVDVFDAATGSRPYRKALDVSAAMNILSDNAGKLFDEEIVECWNKTMA